MATTDRSESTPAKPSEGQNGPSSRSTSPQLHRLQYETMEDKLAALEHDNSALRAMLARHTTDHAPPDNTPTKKLQDDIIKQKQCVRAEQEKRRGAEILAIQERDASDVARHRKEIELRSTQQQLLAARNELAATTVRLQEAETLVHVLKKENHRLLELLQVNKIDPNSDGPPSYFAALGSARPERLRQDVPSSKPFSQVLRSISPLLQPRNHTPTRRTMVGNEPTKHSKGVTSSVVSVDGSVRSPVATVDPRGRQAKTPTKEKERSGTPNRYSLANPQRENRKAGLAGQSPRPGSQASAGIGSRVVWRGTPGIIRYIGPVQSIGGSGEWVGVELLVEGSGDHNGTLNSVRYFVSPPKSAVFCRMSELVTTKERFSKAEQRSSSPPKTPK